MAGEHLHERVMKSRSRRSLLLLTTAACAALGGCGGAGATSPNGADGGPSDGDGGGRDLAFADVGQATALTGLVAISGGLYFSCALTADGAVYCWGANDVGQSGHPVTDVPTGTAFRVLGLGKALAIASGDHHTCVVLDDGTVWCWGGENEKGELGRASQTPGGAPTPMKVEGLSGATRIFGGDKSTCAVVAGAPVSCWGEVVSSTGSPTPIASGLPESTLSVSTWGAGYGLAVLADGSLVCWGASLDDCGTYAEPKPFTRLTAPAKQVVSGAGSCALLADETVQCWGSNVLGTLGNGSLDGSLPVDHDPAIVMNLGTARYLVGRFATMCAVTTDADVKCWGGAMTTGRHVTATIMEGLSSATAVAAGNTYACAILTDTTARCWGLPMYRGDQSRDAPAGPGGPVLVR